MPQLPRHDHIAFLRQGYLAAFMLMLDGFLIVLSLIVAYADKWRPFTPDRLLLSGTLALASWLCLLLAAGTLGGLRDMWGGGIGRGPATQGHRDTDFFAKRRMVFFYAGVNLNLLTLAVLVEQTGGITTSPYITVFFSLILTGQQLSRFKTQSSLLISAGVALTAAMWAYESASGLLKSPAPPSTLTFLVVVTIFIGCGLITNYEKDHNYRVERSEQNERKNLPTKAHVYRDAKGFWHYAIYCEHHRLDPVIHHNATEATEAERSRALVRQKVEDVVKSMCQTAGWGEPAFDWQSYNEESELIIQFSDKASIA